MRLHVQRRGCVRVCVEEGTKKRERERDLSRRARREGLALLFRRETGSFLAIHPPFRPSILPVLLRSHSHSIHFMSISSTSKMSVALGGMTPPAPRAPYA